MTLAGYPPAEAAPAAPDWPTGIALGIGGLAGAYTGARHPGCAETSGQRAKTDG